MPLYRIHRIKETPRENFRWTAHTGGEVVVKQKDYEAEQAVSAATPYAAWKQLQEKNVALVPGDLLEVLEEEAVLSTPDSPEREPQLLISKYIGFDPARWFVPEPKNSDSRTGLARSSEAAAPVSIPNQINS